MAFRKFGAAILQKKELSLGEWAEIRHRAGKSADIKVDAKLLRLGKFTPDRYLLSHSTIISSVDVEDNDFYITPKTTKYVNSNNDAWERKLLLGTYRSFCGAENYLEHVQVPTLSKGKILDAVARDLGDSIYVDILVATNRKHADLIKKIEAGELNGMSMGCTVAYTFCSRCGHKAHDETELCPHILYGKGDTFIDERGVERKIAELCGHRDDPDSVAFIEASWVKNPAFSGAVKRNTIHSLDAETLAAALETRGPKVVAIRHGLSRVANLVRSASLSAPERENMTQAIHQAMRVVDVVAKSKKRRREEEAMPEMDRPRSPEDLEPYQNDNLHVEASAKERWVRLVRSKVAGSYKISDEDLFRYKKFITIGMKRGWDALKDQMTQRQFLTAVALAEQVKGHKGLTPRLAKVLEATGSLGLYASKQTFLERCAGLLSRPLVSAEKEMLLHYGGLMGRFAEGRRMVSV